MSRIYPIGSGKGGSGKSFINANLGTLLARQGKSVVLIDLDLGGSNLHTFFGLKNPKTGLNEFLNKTFKHLDQVVAPTIIPNLFMISSTDCSMEIANLFHTQKIKIIKAIKRLPYDYILLDLGAGTNFNTLDFFLTSNEGLFVATPEPTSIENAFRFIKAANLRIIKQVLKPHDLNLIVNEIRDTAKNVVIKSPSDIVEILIKHDPNKGRMLQNKLSGFKFSFVLNQFRKQTDEALGKKIENVCNKHFYFKFQCLGNINYDEKVYDSIFSKKIYVNKYPYTLTAMDLQNISKRLTENGQNSFMPSLKIS